MHQYLARQLRMKPSQGPGLRDDNFDTSVLLTSGHRGIGGHGAALPYPRVAICAVLHPVFEQEIPDRISTALREVQVVGICTHIIGMAFDHYLALRILLEKVTSG